MRDEVMQILIGLVMVGLGTYMFYTERAKPAKRDWVVILGAILMAVGAIYGFGVFFGSIILVEDMMDWFKEV